MKKSWSWGNFPKVKQRSVTPKRLLDAFANVDTLDTVLPYGCGRSYGDSPVNDQGGLVRMANHNQFIQFDEETGVLVAEAGVTLHDVLQVVVPRGWFLQVTPGTQFVTLGGAIANDVHGKNHHSRGTFGESVVSFTLLRSDGSILTCSHHDNVEMFAATVGGLGLTGFIQTVTLQLRAIESPVMRTVTTPFENLDEGLALLAETEQRYEYTVAWVDCLAQGDDLGRGILMNANHAPLDARTATIDEPGRSLSVPFNFPGFALNRWSVKAFNELYYRNGWRNAGEGYAHYLPYFYPLDGILNWNRIYGADGFFQYQCVVPFEGGPYAIRQLLTAIAEAGEASFLAVLKTFGDYQGEAATQGLLSFPMTGITLALDIPNRGHKTLVLMDALDDTVMAVNGRVYPAKDARMSAKAFQTYFPNWQQLAELKDPKINSNFWRRVTEGVKE